MPLEILGPLVVSGILFAVLFVRFVANAPARLIADKDVAKTILLRDYPDIVIGSDVFISDHQTNALLSLVSPDNLIGFVQVMGSKHITRLLGAADIESFSSSGEKLLTVDLKELTLPQITFRFSNTQERSSALELLKASVISSEPGREKETEK